MLTLARLKEMLEELNAGLATERKEAAAEAAKYFEAAQTILKKFTKVDTFRDCRLGRGWSHEETELSLECGYWNSKENRIDFGSTYFVRFNIASQKLTINAGTIGEYGVDDPFVVQRDLDRASIWQHYTEIVTALASLDLTAWDRREAAADDTNSVIYKVKSQITELETQELLKDVQVGTSWRVVNYAYNNHVNRNARLSSGDDFTIQKIVKGRNVSTCVYRCQAAYGKDFSIAQDVMEALIRRRLIISIKDAQKADIQSAC